MFPTTPCVGADALYAAFDLADPPFERDDARCGPGPGDGYVGYVGTQSVCADALIDEIRDAPGIVEGRVDEVVLLTSRPALKTVYRVGAARRVILPLGNLIRRHDTPLTIRGQRDADGKHLIWFKGLDLIDTICDPQRVLDVEACRAGHPWDGDKAPNAVFDRRYEMTSLALVEDAQITRALREADYGLDGVTKRGARSYCVRMVRVRGIVLADLAFEDCWITAILVVNSREVELRGARIHGSTFGFLAVATSGMEADAHSYRVNDTHWIQSPGAYRPQEEACAAPHLDLSCAVDVWDELPWGVAHHHIWRPLNGALFGAYNIAGNVLIENNILERAYNGVRIISEHDGTGRNVEIRGNRFRFLRDNAVEPEVQADGWVVKHNVFENVHAWISSDGVRGGSMYVFGNTGWYDPDQIPGQRCNEDVAWDRSPFFTGLAGDEGRYVLIDVAYDPTSVACKGHYRGVILKTGDKRKVGFPYFDWISIFNNSWRTRSPLFSSKHASPLSHFNNAIAFTGCGLEGPWHCRQIPAPPEDCVAGKKGTRGRVALRQFWTSDGGALVADCFTVTSGPAQPDERVTETRDVEHAFCRDVVNRPFDGFPYRDGPCELVVDPDLFIAGGGGDLRLKQPIDGCQPRLAKGVVIADCNSSGPPVGALLADGSLFDFDIPGAGYLGDAFRP